MERMESGMKRQEAEVREVKEDVVEVKDSTNLLRSRMERAEEKMIEQEARSRRNNVVFHGIEERVGEDCIRIVKDLAREKCELKGEIRVERAHRMGPKQVGSRARPRPLICRFLDFQDKEELMKRKKRLPKGVYAGDDLPLEVREARRQLKGDLDEAKRQGKEAWIAYPARLIVDRRQVKVVKPTVSGGKGGSV